MNYTLELYRQMFATLKRGNSKGVFSNAKPIFLITLIDYIPQLCNNQLKWLDVEFKYLYIKNFSELDDTMPTPIWKPFYYLSSEPFYTLIWKDNMSVIAMRHPSSKMLKDFLSYAMLDEELWNLLQDETNRTFLRNNLIKQYLVK